MDCAGVCWESGVGIDERHERHSDRGSGFWEALSLQIIFSCDGNWYLYRKGTVEVLHSLVVFPPFFLSSFS